MIQRHRISSIAILLVIGTLGIMASLSFQSMKAEETLFPAKSLTKKGRLSDYFNGIKGTRGDSEVFIFDSGQPGATVFLAGGTHPNEPAGYMAAVLVLENAGVENGRLIVVPRMNNSAFTANDPMEGYPQHFTLQTRSGKREFRFGSRATNPLDQWPDPLVYTHFPSGQQFSGNESRNLNRAYPGRPDGSFTEKIAYAIIQLIVQEKVDVAFDLHEAAPEIPIINAIVYHEKCEDITMSAVLELEMTMEEAKYAPELSPKNFHGLSHREWGDHTDAAPFLMETSSPVQGRLRGRTNEDLILSGQSDNYLAAKETGALRIDYREEGESLDHRVGRHISGFKAILSAYNEMHPDKTISISGLPDYPDIMEYSLGNYLN